MILSNTVTNNAKITITVNTIDTIKDFIVKFGETKIFDVFIVLEPNNVSSIQQEKMNAINVMINCTLETIFIY